jgi:hypothetical protein
MHIFSVTTNADLTYTIAYLSLSITEIQYFDCHFKTS